MGKFQYDPEKHGKPHDAYDLDLYFYIIHRDKDSGKLELLVFKKQVPYAGGLMK